MNKLPAGAYYVGDCCYCLNDEIDWSDEFCEQWFSSTTGEPFQIRGYWVAASSTAFGDGVYNSNIGAKFPVDAGLIGVIPVELAKPDAENIFGCTVVTFTEPFSVSYKEGIITIGHIEIYTDEEPEDSRDDEDWFINPNE